MLICAVLAMAIAAAAVPMSFSDTADGSPTPSASISENIYAKVGETVNLERTIDLTDATFAYTAKDTLVTDWFTGLSDQVTGLEVKVKDEVSAGAISITLTFSGTPSGTDSLSKTLSITIPAASTSSTENISANYIYMLRDAQTVQEHGGLGARGRDGAGDGSRS